MSLEDKARRFIYQKLKESIIKCKMEEVKSIIRAIKVMFPEDSELAICDLIFNICRDRYSNNATEKIVRYFNHLINECHKHEILSMPRGGELYRLGKWLYKKEPHKAKMYLESYLCAQNQREEVYGSRWLKQAERLLKRRVNT
jgi:hypothetical protein